MATKYSDIVDLRSGRSTYYLEEEKAGDWSVFIVNDQFNDILRTVVRSVMNNDLDAHKSFWIEGTYGTGKTHAGAVLKHLLCDDVSAIEEWLREEYIQSPNQKIPDRKTKCVIKTHINIKQNVIFGAKLKPV